MPFLGFSPYTFFNTKNAFGNVQVLKILKTLFKFITKHSDTTFGYQNLLKNNNNKISRREGNITWKSLVLNYLNDMISK